VQGVAGKIVYPKIEAGQRNPIMALRAVLAWTGGDAAPASPRRRNSD